MLLLQTEATIQGNFCQSFSTQSCENPVMRFFVGFIVIYVCLLLLYAKIPIQQILHVLCTVGYKFVYDLENWFSLPWLWRHGTIMSLGEVPDKSKFLWLGLSNFVWRNFGFWPSMKQQQHMCRKNNLIFMTTFLPAYSKDHYSST